MYIHTSEFVSFKRIQYSTWCQNRGCICISSTRRTYRSNPAVFCIHSVIQTRNIILQTELILQEEEEREWHPHTPYKIPQVHFYRILQGELGFFSKGLSIALSCKTKVRVVRNSLSYCFLHIILFYKKFQEN